MNTELIAAIDAAPTQSEADLVNEFAAWCNTQPGFEEGDAMDHLHRDDLQPYQRKWLSDFVIRWEKMRAREREQLALAAWYLTTIGYDPFKDDPNITVEDVRRIKADYLALDETEQ